jgi:hypothetical protein
MAKIDLDEFRVTLGVGTLYPDEMLQQVADAADQLVDGLLDYNSSSIWSYEVDNANKVTYYTYNNHYFNTGDSVTVSGLSGVFNGTKTITDSGNRFFTVAETHAQLDPQKVKPFARVILASQAELYDLVPAIREAALAVAVEIFQQRTSPGGQIQAVDFTPAPHRLGRALLTRVTGLIAPYMNMGGFVG